MKIQSILIVGGGIGGLATAIALRKRGLKAHVVELKPDMHSSVFGVGIIQPVNALRALDAIDCLEPCLEAGYSTRAWGLLLDVEGNKVKEIPGASIPGDNKDYPPMNGVTRPRLHEILTGKALELGATIEYNKTAVAIVDGPEGARVTFNGDSQGTFDVVVGADGANSKIREFVFSDSVKSTPTGQSAFRLNIPRVVGDTEIDRIILQEGPKGKGKAGFVPIGPDLAYFFYNSAWDRNVRIKQEEQPAALRECLKDFGGITGLVRDHYVKDESYDEIVFRAFDGLIAPPPWHKGRTVMIGDAVHTVTPHFGQGAAQAIEDGIVLAECLVSQHKDLDAAFNEYCDRRYERTKLIVDSGIELGKWEMNPVEGMVERQAQLTQRIIETMVQPI